LVVIDVQQGMFAFRRPLYHGEEVLERIASLFERARDARVPFHVRHNGGPGHILAKGSMGWPHHPFVHPRSGRR
jgi:nicotinamidase-related amidase